MFLRIARAAARIAKPWVSMPPPIHYLLGAVQPRQMFNNGYRIAQAHMHHRPGKVR